MSKLNEQEKAGQESLADDQEAVNNRRDFLKKAGKYAIYTPPVMMMLMHPSANAFNKSACVSNGKPGNNDNGTPVGILSDNSPSVSSGGQSKNHSSSNEWNDNRRYVYRWFRRFRN